MARPKTRMNAPPPPRPQEVTLAPPGAGLPALEGWFFRRVAMPLADTFMSREAALRKFDAEGRRALELARDVPPSRLTEPVLIDRIAGIEDSSRHWSIAMTLQHLIIVGRGIRLTVLALNRGKVPGRAIRIEDVKPDPAVGVEILDTFAEWLDAYPGGLRNLPWPDEPELPHPWFGPMNAGRWLKLNAIHNGIHRRQIEAIIARLPSGNHPVGEPVMNLSCAAL